MKKSEMLMWLQRHYGIRHVMVESGYITVKDFCEEVLLLMEQKGMVPPIIEEESFQMLPSGELTYAVHEWEPEKEKT